MLARTRRPPSRIVMHFDDTKEHYAEEAKVFTEVATDECASTEDEESQEEPTFSDLEFIADEDEWEEHYCCRCQAK